MFGIGLPELLLIMAIALIVLGPEKLPQVAKQIAKYMGELKRASDEFKKQLEIDAIKEIRERDIWDQEEGFGAKKTAGNTADGEKQEKSELPGGLGPEWKVAKGPKDQEKKDEETGQEYTGDSKEETRDSVN